ncbi:MAG: hypothetical protein OES38_05795 [Gammaproteobacteria bacterium]|nr:hypothetical protein [Gammaproteobacteria bacterium]
MRVVLPLLLLVSAVGHAAPTESVRFSAIEVYLTTEQPVSAWQFELTEANALMQVVGVENGESPAFADAPYYDRAAVENGLADRITIADFSLADEKRLPVGKTRIATVHLLTRGDREPQLETVLVVATGYNGQAIDASISLSKSTE